MSKDRLLSDKELIEELVKNVVTNDSGPTITAVVDVSKLLHLINTQKRLYAESLRAKDPHLCEFGHEVYSHKTVDGWCCACEADQAFIESEIELRVEQRARIK